MVKKLRRLENTLLLYNSRPLSARAAARPPAAFLRSREFPAYIWARKLCLGVQQKLIPESWSNLTAVVYTARENDDF